MNENSLSLLGQLRLMETRGYSAYEVAQQNGFTGTEEEWLASLVGPQGEQGPEGKSAYQVAVENGYQGTEEDWVNDFLTPDGYVKKEDISITTPEMYGAVGDGVTDDTAALQTAFENGRFIVLGSEKEYLVRDSITVYEGSTVEMNGSTITGDGVNNVYLLTNFLTTDTFLGYDGNSNISVRNGKFEKGALLLSHGENINFTNCDFEDCTTNHWIQLCACKNTVFRDCSFLGMRAAASMKEYINIDNCTYTNFPYFDEDSVTFDGTIVDGLLIDNCIFDVNGSVMKVAVGKHSYYSTEDYSLNRAKNIIIRNTRVIGATEYGFSFQGTNNINIENCSFENCYRAYNLQRVDGVNLNNNMINGNASSHIDNASNVYVISNVVTKSSDTADVYLYNTCNNINYSYNTITNGFGHRLPVYINGDTSISGLTLMNNTYSTVPSVSSNVARGVLAYPPEDSTVTFKNCDDVVFRGLQNKKTATNSSYNLTNFNNLKLYVGDTADDTFQEINIKCFVGSTFAVNDVFKVPIIDSNGDVTVETITITDEHTITSTVLNIRTAYGFKLPRG